MAEDLLSLGMYTRLQPMDTTLQEFTNYKISSNRNYLALETKEETESVQSV